MGRDGGWLDQDEHSEALPPLRDPFAPVGTDAGEDEADTEAGPFGLPPLDPGAALPPIASDRDQAPAAGEPEAASEPAADVPFALDGAGDSPFQLPGGSTGDQDALSAAWLAAAGEAPALPPLASEAPAPLTFALDRDAGTDDTTGFTLDPEADLDAITGAAFLSRSEQSLQGGGFTPRRSRPRPAGPAQPDAGRDDASAPGESGISHAPTTRHDRDADESGISEGPTVRHARDGDDPSTPMTVPSARDSWDGTEGTFISAPPGAADSWDGTDPTMVPGVTPQAEPADSASRESWDGTDPTLVPGAHPPAQGAGADTTDPTLVPVQGPSASDSWDGTEGTMVTPPAGEDWESGATKITPPEGRKGRKSSGRMPWVGTEATAPFMPAGKEGAQGDDAEGWVGGEETLPGTPTGDGGQGADEATRATLVPGKHTPPTLFTTSKRTSSSRIGDGGGASSGGTSTSFDAKWHLAGKPGPATGQVWGDYEVGGIIGQGGMGLVYRAYQKSLGRRCAVKVLSAHLANNTQLLERFELEARAAGTMRSHNVVAVYAAGNVDGQPYYVMEYVDGTDLDHIVKEKRSKEERFTVDEAVDITLQAGRGLVEAAGHGIVHRDIKPPNLMVTRKNEIKITDFGIVKVQGEAGLTMTGQAMGTPAYLSPEQGRGEEVDGRSDLYSLGVVFYELLTGQRPFVGNSADALIYQHSYAEPKLPREIDDSIPEDIQAVCIKLLAKKPENRYQSAKDLVRDLEDFSEGKRLEALLQQKLSTGGAEALRENQSWIQRHGLKIGLAMAALTLVAVGLTVWWTQRSQERARLETQADALVLELESVLGQATPITQSTQQNLAELRELIRRGFADEPAQMAGWIEKIASVNQLRADLADVTSETEWSHQRLVDARDQLDELRSLIGDTPLDVQTWNQLITAVESRVAALKRELGAILRQEFYEVSLRDRRETIEPALAELAPLVAEDDEDLARYRARLAGFDQDLAELIDLLDKAKARDRAADNIPFLEGLQQPLSQARQIYGEFHPDYVAWADAIEDELVAYRELRATFVGHMERLESFQEAPPNELVRSVSTAQLGERREMLGRMIQLEAFPQVSIDEYTGILDALAARWAAIEARGQILRQQLAADLDETRPLGADTVGNLQELESLYGRGYSLRMQAWRRKVDRIGERKDELRGRIDGKFFVRNLGETFLLLRALMRDVGPADQDVRRWARRLDVFYGPDRPPWADDLRRDEAGIYVVVEMPAGPALRLRYIPRGDVTLGSPPDEVGRDEVAKDETQIDVRIGRGLWLMETELTQATWQGVTGSNPSLYTSRSRSLTRPVERINLADAYAFIERLNAQRAEAGQLAIPLRLPGEHEWEYACRAGTDDPFSRTEAELAEGLPLSEFAWYGANAAGVSHPVAGKRANPLGLYDMHGNVWEWCATPYGSYQVLTADNFQARVGDRQAARGGSWGDPPANLRAANRLGVDPELRSAYLGLRLAADISWTREPDGSRILESETPPAERSEFDQGAADGEGEAEMELLEEELRAEEAQPAAAEDAADGPAPLDTSVPGDDPIGPAEDTPDADTETTPPAAPAIDDAAAPDAPAAAPEPAADPAAANGGDENPVDAPTQPGTVGAVPDPDGGDAPAAPIP